MRRGFTLAAIASIVLLIVSQPGCGGGNSSTTPTSGLEERAFVAVNLTSTGSILIVDASKDQLSASSIPIQGTQLLSSPPPQIMIPGPNSTTIEYNSGDNNVNMIDNIKETQVTKIGSIDCTSGTACQIQFAGPVDSLAASSDGKFIYAALGSNSEVSIADLTGSTSVAIKNIPDVPGNCQTKGNCLPGAHRIVLSHNNNKLLVFNETLNQFEIINTPDSTVQTVTGLDHPIYGVFSADDSKAYILNCGAECGGTQASIVTVDMSSLGLSQPVNVDAATIGTADTNNLYVAGSNPATPGAGSVTVLPLSSLTGGKQIKIGDGFHQVISSFQGKVIVGARTCTTGCLSIVDPNAGTAIIDTPAAGQPQKGDVLAIAPVAPRKVFYTAEGGELRIYDATTGVEELLNTAPMIDIVGKVTSVLYVGPKT
ncbi:MAG TPA: hypothetical protein VFU50_15195 [Terriglobales bacterium]|nr:hypothetical protein [Terriglobales bacterium]